MAEPEMCSTLPRLALMSLSLIAAPAAWPRDLTVVAEFDGEAADRAYEELSRELRSALKPARLNVDVRRREQLVPGENFADIVYVRFRGTCRMERLAPWIDERGPYAWTQTVNGEVLPFSEVECDRVRRSIHQAMGGVPEADRDRLLGRALGRVVAHEVMHALRKSPRHDDRGVYAKTLTGRQLVSGKLPADPHSLLGIEP